MPDQDTLTLTVRLHDPVEKKNAKLSASWAVIAVPRADLALSAAEFGAKHLLPAVEKLEHFKPQPLEENHAATPAKSR
jgi:hypothetical protein